MPKISVLMPVKNGEKYLAEAIDSVLDQTFKDFELLIFNDNSTDLTMEIINSYSDDRIKVYNGTNGLIANLNRGIEKAHCPYIARMDADDVMNPSRLEKQLETMETLSVDVCSSWLIVFGEGFQPYVQHHNFQGLIEDPLEKFSKVNFIAHPSVMMRKEFFINNNLRYVNYPHAEDYKLWTEVAKKKGVFYIDPEPLLAYRLSREQITRNNADEVINQSAKIEQEVIAYLRESS